MRSAARLVALVATLVAWHWGRAESRDPDLATAPTLAELLADFERFFEPSGFVALPLADAGVALTRAEQRAGAVVSLGETVVASWRGATELRVDAQLALPLYSTSLPREVEIASAGLVAAQVELAAERSAAKAAFLGDLYAAALFADLLAQLDSAVAALVSAYPVLGDAADDYRAVAATLEDRMAIENASAAEDLRAHLAAQLAAIEDRVDRAQLGRARFEAGAIEPLLPELRAVLAARAAPSDAACLAGAPAAAVARARHQQATLASDLQSVADFNLRLTASASLSTTSGVTGFATLSAELILPAASPLSGTGSIVADAEGATQRLELRWPALPTAQVVAGDPARDLALALDDVLRARRSAVVAVERAERERDLAALRLQWFVADADANPQPRSTVEEGVGPASFADPLIALQAVDLRARLAFAELSVALAHSDLALICGWAP